MPEFRFQEMFPHGDDTTPYRRIDGDWVSADTFRGQPVLTVDAAALTRLASRSGARRLASLPTGSSDAAAHHPRRHRGVAERPLRRPQHAEERQHLRRHGAAVLPGHRHGDRHRQEGPAACGRTPTTKRRWRAASSTSTRAPTCATRSSRRSRCTTRSTPERTCPRRSSSTPPAATSTTSSSSPRAAARRTNRFSTRRRRRC